MFDESSFPFVVVIFLQKIRKEMESQIRKQRLRQLSSTTSLPNLSKVSPCLSLVFFSLPLLFDILAIYVDVNDSANPSQGSAAPECPSLSIQLQ